VGILGLLAIGLTLTASPVVYRTVGKLQTVIIAEVVIWLVIAVFAGTTADAWGDFVKGFEGFGTIPFGENEAVTAAVIAGAIAFAGAATSRSPTGSATRAWARAATSRASSRRSRASRRRRPRPA
jgi:hypothetical protein